MFAQYFCCISVVWDPGENVPRTHVNLPSSASVFRFHPRSPYTNPTLPLVRPFSPAVGRAVSLLRAVPLCLSAFASWQELRIFLNRFLHIHVSSNFRPRLRLRS